MNGMLEFFIKEGELTQVKLFSGQFTSKLTHA